MAKDEKQSEKNSPRMVNRRARHDFHISEVVECGIELQGTEVKSIRSGLANIEEAYARLSGGQVYLVGMTIAAYPQAAEGMQHEPTRDRRLLLRRGQIAQLEAHVRQKGKTLIPMAIYFKRGWAKCELGIAEGKQHQDKREDLRKKDHQREIAREMSRRNR